jgi:dTDP-4-dehydrorhamnose 3,5-epimerase
VEVKQTGIPGLLAIEPKIFGDSRGFFLESYNKKRYEEAGITDDFCQDNLSFSRRGVLRGLHVQNPNPQGKLVSVIQGEVYDVAVDIRKGSPTFGKWYGLVLSAERKNQLFVPKGFAHGFCVLSETALFSYKCSDFYNVKAEICLKWNDPSIGIEWPIRDPELSAKDSEGLLLKDIPLNALVEYKA